MEYHLTYQSTNVYSAPTSEVFLDFLILPAETDDLSLSSYKITTSPHSKYTLQQNKYGFNLVRFIHLSGLTEFTLNMECRVIVNGPLTGPDLSKESQQSRSVLNSINFRHQNYFFLLNTELTTLDPETLQTCLITDNESVFEYLLRLKDHVYHMLEYVPGVTDIQTQAQQALKIGKGVCQDFSHIFIGFCRSAGIASRYVSGYLFVGDGVPAQLHAWTESLIPGMGWVGIDPTNHLLTNENYIKIAHGTDYSECPSIKGVIRGQVNQTTTYKVGIQQQTQ